MIIKWLVKYRFWIAVPVIGLIVLFVTLCIIPPKPVLSPLITQPPTVLNITVGETRFTIPQSADLEALQSKSTALKEENATLVFTLEKITLERNQLLGQVATLAAADCPEVKDKWLSLQKRYEIQLEELRKIKEFQKDYDALLNKYNALVTLHDKCED